jgi:hypothetical protein
MVCAAGAVRLAIPPCLNTSPAPPLSPSRPSGPGQFGYLHLTNPPRLQELAAALLASGAAPGGGLSSAEATAASDAEDAAP